MSLRATALTLAIACAAAALAAQTPTARFLARPDAEFATPFSSVTGVRELKDGRVLVADRKENTLRLVDFKSGNATPATREGDGPGEFRLLNRLLPYGDSTIMFDSRGSRFLVFDAAGGSPHNVPAPASMGHDLYGAPSGDARAHVYVQVDARATVKEQVPDSGFVARYQVGGTGFDTIAVVRVSRTDVSTFSDGKISGFRTLEVPFAVHDDWAAFPDGRVAVIRGADYHVDWYDASGHRKAGPATSHPAIPVTADDRKAVLASRQPKAGVNPGKVPLIIEPSIWYPVKAPFTESSAWAGPGGELWVQVYRPFGDDRPTYDIFTAKGLRRATVALPAGVRLVAFGAHTLYAVRTDADDLLYLQRYDLKPISAECIMHEKGEQGC